MDVWSFVWPVVDVDGYITKRVRLFRHLYTEYIYIYIYIIIIIIIIIILFEGAFLGTQGHCTEVQKSFEG